MDDITTRAIVIAVNVFITITIVSLVVIMFFQMREVYGLVATTETSIYNKFDDVYSMYHGKVETGIGLLNTLKKYEDNNDPQIKITYDGYEQIRGKLNENEREAVVLKEKMNKRDGYSFEDKYNVTVSEDEDEPEKIIIDYNRVVQVK